MAKKVVYSEPLPEQIPALTPEARQGQLISLAYDVVEKRLRDGTASSQETTHFLKLATAKARLEEEKIRQENELIKAKVNALSSAEASEKLYSEAIKAFGIYRGGSRADEY